MDYIIYFYHQTLQQVFAIHPERLCVICPPAHCHSIHNHDYRPGSPTHETTHMILGRSMLVLYIKPALERACFVG